MIDIHAGRIKIVRGHHVTGTILPIGLLTDQFDIHIRSQADNKSLRSRRGTIGHYNIHFLEIQVGVRDVLANVIVFGLIFEFGREICVEVLISPCGGKGLIEYLGLEDIPGDHTRIWSYQRGKLALCLHKTATIISEIQDELLNTLFLELPEHHRKGLHRFDIKRVIDKVAHGLLSYRIGRVDKDRILPHVHSCHGNIILHITQISISGEMGNAKGHISGIESVINISGCDFLAINLHYDVTSFQSGLFGGTILCDIGDNQEVHPLLIRDPARLEIITIRQAKPLHGVGHRFQVISKLCPVIDLLIVGMVTDIMYNRYGIGARIRIKFPKVVVNLLAPKVISGQSVNGELVSLLDLL